MLVINIRKENGSEQLCLATENSKKGLGRYSPPQGQEPKEPYRQPPPRGVGWTLERVTNGCNARLMCAVKFINRLR